MTIIDDARRRILAAARLYFTTQPYDSVAMRDVAWDASLPLGMVRRHFADKAALFAAMLDDCLDGDCPLWADPAILALVLRSLADPATAALTADRVRNAGLGSLDTHHLLAAAKVLDGVHREGAKS